MERMKLWLLPVYAVIGFIALVALLPQSRWVPQTQWDVLAGRWRYLAGPDGIGGTPYVEPIQRGLTEEDSANDETAAFLRLLAPNRPDADTHAYDRRMASLYKICAAKDTPEYLAQFVRAMGIVGMIRKDQALPIGTSNQQIRARLQLVKSACEQGARLDPENAFFPAMEAGALYNLGDAKGSATCFERASRLPIYRDYVKFEPTLRYRYLLDHHGYRGKQLEASILGQVLLPHLTVIRTIADRYSRSGDLQARLASVRMSRLMLQQDETLIGLMVARSMLSQALLGDRQTDHYRPLGPDQMLRLAEGFQKASGDRSIVPLVQSVTDLSKGLDVHPWPDLESLQIVLNLRPAYSATALLSVLLLPAALGIGRLRARSARFAAAGPYLLWLGAFAAEVFGPQNASTVPFGAVSLLFFPALVPRLRGFVDALGIAALAWALFSATIGIPLATIAVLFPLTLLVERRAKAVPLWISAGYIVAACIAAAIVWVMLAIHRSGGDGAVFGGMAALGLFAAIPVRPGVRWAPVTGLCAMILGVGFGAAVYRDLTEDRVVAVACEQLLNEAEGIRSATHAFDASGP